MPVWTITVGTQPKKLLTGNKNRKVYSILNTSGETVYVGFSSKVTTTGKFKGIPVEANGGFWTDEYHKGEVWAVASSETEVTVIEVTEEEQPK